MTLKTRKRRTGRFWLYGFVLCLALFLGWRLFFSGGEQKSGMPADMQAPPVRTAKAIVQDVPHFLTGLGTVVPSSDVLVRSRVDGQLIRLHFREGQRVNAGDLLAEIDPRPFQSALEQAQGALQKDQALLENAKSDLARYAKLVKGDYIASQQYENQKSLVRQYEGIVDSDKAAVEAARLQVEYSRITAPVGGRLGLKAVDEGNQIKAADANGVVRITETSPCDVIFTIPESQVSLVASQLHEREINPDLPPLQAFAYDREDRELLATGELISLDNQIDVATGTVRLKARFANDEHKLYPNQFVNVRLLARELKDVVTVPAAAVQLGARGSYCYIVKRLEENPAEGTVELEHVIPGLVVEDVQVIEKGVSDGQEVVIDGVDRLRTGLMVRIAAEIETPRIDQDGQEQAPEQ